MKILYFISVHGHGRGGHFHSLNHVVNNISLKHETGIISIGISESQIITNNKSFIKHINHNGINIIRLQRELKKIILDIKPDIIHFFDSNSYNICRPLISRQNKIVLNKCGGPNIKFYPFAKNLIVFSQENYDFFKNKKKYQNSQIYLISNRVQKIFLNPYVSNIKKNTDLFNFVRICRISEQYKKSILNSINLIKYLTKKGSSHTHLFIIGIIEDNFTFKEILKYSNKIKNITFLTENEFTQEASKMLYLADAVIGTGRGFMEAASLQIPLLTLNSLDDYPVLIDQETYCDAFKTNFSERNKFHNFDKEKNLSKIIKMISDNEYRKQLSDFSYNIFSNYFDAELICEKYTEAYNQADPSGNIHVFDYILSLKDSFNLFKKYKTLNK